MAWGKKPTLAEQHVDELKPGDEECKICMQRPVSIQLRPCVHTLCKVCVDELRANNIFKPDAGVKCPYCRQFIDGYEPLQKDGAVAQPVNRELAEANRAAMAAANARRPVQQRVQDVHAPQQASAPAERKKWECKQCGNQNYLTRDACNKCGRKIPLAVAAARAAVPLPAAGKDVLMCSPADLFEFACQKMHPHLERAFIEAGTPTVDGRTEGSTAQILACLKKRGQERLLHIIRVLTENDYLPKLVSHFFGNYTLQNLLDAGYMLRHALQELQAEGPVSPALQQQLVGSFSNGQRDALGQLIAHIIPVAAENVRSSQGYYVLYKVAEVAHATELLPLAPIVFQQAIYLSLEVKQNAWLLIKIVEQLWSLAQEGSAEDRARVGAEMVKLCAIYSGLPPPELAVVARSFTTGPMLKQAIHAALPSQEACKLLGQVCEMADNLSRSKGGCLTLRGLLELDVMGGEDAASVSPETPDAREFIETNVCVVAEKLESAYAAVLGNMTVEGHELIRQLVCRLKEINEEEWVLAIADELTGCVNNYHANSDAMGVMCYTLSLLPDDARDTHLESLQEKLGDTSHIRAVLGLPQASPGGLRVQAVPPPPPPPVSAHFPAITAQPPASVPPHVALPAPPPAAHVPPPQGPALARGAPPRLPALVPSVRAPPPAAAAAVAGPPPPVARPPVVRDGPVLAPSAAGQGLRPGMPLPRPPGPQGAALPGTAYTAPGPLGPPPPRGPPPPAVRPPPAARPFLPALARAPPSLARAGDANGVPGPLSPTAPAQVAQQNVDGGPRPPGPLGGLPYPRPPAARPPGVFPRPPGPQGLRQPTAGLPRPPGPAARPPGPASVALQAPRGPPLSVVPPPASAGPTMPPPPTPPAREGHKPTPPGPAAGRWAPGVTQGLANGHATESADVNSAEPAVHKSWSCTGCTYEHVGKEADFLACAVCGQAAGS